jgi:hypothetical protein
MALRALFVGGVIDNNELDLDSVEPPLHYPPETGSGQPRYRLHAVGHAGDGVACAVYGAPGLDPGEVMRVSDERAYARRFEVALREVA